MLLAAAFVLCGALAETMATANTTITVYTSPDIASADVAGTIRKGAKVTVRAVSRGIAKIVVKGRNYYVDVSTLTMSGETAPSNPNEGSASSKPVPEGTKPTFPQKATITANSLTVFRKPSKSAERIGVAHKGVAAEVLAVSGQWAAVRIAGKIGYCSYAGLSNYVDHTQPAPSQPLPQEPAKPGASEQTYLVNAKGTCIALDALSMYKKPSTFEGSYGKFKVGASLSVTAVSGEWAKIVYKGKTGYVLRKGLRPATADDAANAPVSGNASGVTHQTVAATKLYQKPNTSSRTTKTLAAGKQVYVKAVSGAWAKLVYSGVTCYAQLENLIELDQRTDGLVVVSQAKLFEKPNAASASVGTLSEGTSVDVYGTSGGWAKILFDNRRVYVQETSLYLGKAAYGQLKNGDTGTNVQALQNRLETLGYFDGVPAGNYGSITVAAIKRFQQQKGLSVTGVANNATQAALYAKNAPASTILTANLSSGTTGDSVTRLQTRLLYKNYYRDSIDGSFGTGTTAAVTAFQKKVGLSENGVADAATLRALFAPNAPRGENVRPAGSNGTPSLDPPDVTSDNEDIETVIQHALAQLGKPYVYGTHGPNSFDCSGLTYYCFKKVGITLPRTARDVGYSEALGERIPYEQLRRGDIVCFNTISDSDLSDHVGIYLGDGKFIHAPHTGSDVIVASMSSGYYVRNYSWARRVIR